MTVRVGVGLRIGDAAQPNAIGPLNALPAFFTSAGARETGESGRGRSHAPRLA